LYELHKAGIEVDYTRRLDELKWERIKQFNVLVVYELSKGEPGKTTAALIDRYLKSGGGVLLFPTEHNTQRHPLFELTNRYGARVPTERITETDSELIATFDHMPNVRVAYTPEIAKLPITEGVKHIWYPISAAYNAGHTTPIEVEDSWQVVLRGSATSTSVPVDLAKSLSPELENAYSRPGPVPSPAFFAVRQLGAGRLGLLNQWRVYTVGSGTKWLFYRQLLSRGFDQRPSDMGRLLENTYRWLAAPSLETGAVGGYQMPEDRLVPPNLQPQVAEDYRRPIRLYDLDEIRGRPRRKMTLPYRGLIGARTGLSSGRGTVAEFARVARGGGLDFVVFLEEFSRMTREKLDQLKAECAAASDEQLQLYAGMTMTDNIGNRMFLTGPDPVWVPDYCLTGPGKKLFYRQAVDEDGAFTGYGTPGLDWALATYHHDGNIGYYHFSADPHSNRIQHLRLYAMAALRTYEAGRLVEDVTEDYLRSAAGTIPPTPVCVNLVASPEELDRELKRGRGLTYCQATERSTIFRDALRWTHQYDAVNTYPSDGPQILAWPGCVRVGTLGSENFVTTRSVMRSPIAVRSDKGLREVRVYNGPELYRRFVLDGRRNVWFPLVHDATVQKNMVLVAEDREGGTAVSYARRCWKDGGREVVFCSDHVNDCKSGGMLLAHGATGMLVNWPPPIHESIAGHTWDGGPPAALPLATWQANQPHLSTSLGSEDGGRFNQTPLLEFTDSGAAAVSSEKRDLFDPQMQRVVNPWHTFGPVGYPPQLMTFTQRYREWLNPTVGVPPVGWAGPGVREGGNASIYRCDIRFEKSYTVLSLDLLAEHRPPPQKTALLAVGGPKIEAAEIDLFSLEQPQVHRLDRGDWFALYSRATNSAQIMTNRAAPLDLIVSNPRRDGWIRLAAADMPRDVDEGKSFRCELASLAFPVSVSIHSLDDVLQYVRYLENPDRWEILRGERIGDSPGIVDLKPIDYAVEFCLSRPAQPLPMTLPVRVTGLNRRWSAGLFQERGYVKGDHGSGKRRYRALGLDVEGNAYVPVYANWDFRTHLRAGHPVVAGPEASELFIQVTRVSDAPPRFHVAVNNPTDQKITTTLRAPMPMLGLDVYLQRVTLRPGEYLVVQ
jgi:hypothetical protein